MSGHPSLEKMIHDSSYIVQRKILPSVQGSSKNQVLTSGLFLFTYHYIHIPSGALPTPYISNFLQNTSMISLLFFYQTIHINPSNLKMVILNVYQLRYHFHIWIRESSPVNYYENVLTTYT